MKIPTTALFVILSASMGSCFMPSRLVTSSSGRVTTDTGFNVVAAGSAFGLRNHNLNSKFAIRMSTETAAEPETYE